MKKSKFSRRTVLRSGASMMGGIATAALVGCGDDDDTGDDSPNLTTAVSPGVTASPSAQARQGGKLRLLSANIGVADIHQAVLSGAVQAAQWSLDTLMTYDEPVAGDITLKPALAASLEQPDAQTYVFKLRPGVKFQDVEPVNGRTLTADDVIFSLKRLATDDPKFPRRSWMQSVASYEAVDSTTVRIKTKEPIAAFSYLLANPWVGIIAKEQVDRDGAVLKSFIGTGPYIATRVEPASVIQLKRNPAYWGAPAPYFDEVEIANIPDPSAQQSAFRAGELHAIESLPADLRTSFKNQNPGATEYRAPIIGNGIVAMNLRRKPFDDVRVRQAIAYALDIPGWIQTIYGGEAELTGPIAPNFVKWALPKDRLTPYKRNLAESKKLLEAAGVAPASLTIKNLLTAGVPTLQNQAVQFQADLKELGVNVQIDAVPAADFGTRWAVSHDFDVMVGFDFSADDPDRLNDRFLSTAGANYGGYSNPALDDLLKKQTQTLEEKERQALARAAQELLLKDVPFFYTFIPWNLSYTGKGIKSWRTTAVAANDRRWNARNAWIES